MIGTAVLFFLALSYFRFFEIAELQTYDWRCQLRAQRPVSDQIILIDIWDDTLKNLGAWPLDRSYHADLIRILNAAGVQAIGFDILFAEPRPGDDKVIEAAREAKNVYFSEAFLNPQTEKGRFTSHQVLAPLLQDYRKTAKGVGHVNAFADPDGKRRRIFPAVFYENQPSYQLSFCIAKDILGENLNVPLDEEGFFIVNYAGKWEKTFQHYSFYDILAAAVEMNQGLKPRIDLGKLRGKICFVGLTSLGSHDTSPVPVQSVYPMVGMYANVLNNILENDFIRRLDRISNLIILFLMGGWVVFVSLRLKPRWAIAGLLSTFLLFTGLSVWLFEARGIWSDLFTPILLMSVCYAAATVSRMMGETRKRELIENELQIASEIQKSFLPSEPPTAKGLDVAVTIKPAKEVGGDLYSFVTLSDGQVGIMVGDVSGKGTPAALFMAKVVSEFKFSAREKEDPSKVLANLNASLTRESTSGLFVTLVYAIFDMRSRKLRLSSGGHLPTVWVDRHGQTGLLSVDGGMPIGLIEEVRFCALERRLEDGDCFAFYSDGINEARNQKKEEFGLETLQKILSENRHLPAADLVNKVISDLGHFTGRASQHDDMTLVIVKVSDAG